MALTIVYLILLSAYLISWAYSASHPNGIPEAVARSSGLIALLMGLVGALQKSSLTVYFLFQRLLVRFSPDTTGRWWFSARYDGHFADSVVRSLTAHLASDKFRFSSKVDKESALTAEVEIDQTLLLKIQFDPAQDSEDGEGHVTVISRVMEVSYGHAKRKIEQQIIPVLQAVVDVLKPSSSSFELDVQFLKRNPFFAVYISHLRPEQVQDYRVVLHVDGSHPSGKPERVEISKERVHVTAGSTHTFKSMAEQFVLLSPDVKLLRAGH
jgi:hypothetical protein